MFYTKDHKTLNMFDPFAHLGPKRLKLMKRSWAQLFRDEILPELPVHKLTEHYDPLKGRPTKELYAMLGLMILQQMQDLTDEEAVNQFAFNIQWHYALNITTESDRDTYICHRTLWSMRSILTEQGLYSDLFGAVTDKLRKLFNVDPDKQRLDSVHICSNMRNLGRIGLFVQTIKKFLVNLKRHHKALFAALDTTLTDRYLTKKGESVFAMVKPSEMAQPLASLGADLFFLVERFAQNDAVIGMHSYQLMVRLLKEQCHIEENSDGSSSAVSVKPSKDVPSDSLQNPSDPDATYDGHKGRGYQVQVMETYSDDEDKDQLNLITYVTTEPAHNNDVHAVIPAIEESKQRGLAPKELLADSLYGSDENIGKAKGLGTDLVAPAIGKTPKTKLTLADFSFSEQSRVTSCPQGHAPLKTKYKKSRHSAVFDSKVCEKCACVGDCPASPGKKAYYVRYEEKEVRVAQRRAHEKTPEFRNKYRFRAGAEATMSEFDRRTGVKQLRVRGIKAVSCCATLKAAGINILRAAAFRNRPDKDEMSQKSVMLAPTGKPLAIRKNIKELNSAMRAYWA